MKIETIWNETKVFSTVEDLADDMGNIMKKHILLAMKVPGHYHLNQQWDMKELITGKIVYLHKYTLTKDIEE